jgi:catechol 2,3-dioxygenase-like lactoylglutathione lyase family enzyme
VNVIFSHLDYNVADLPEALSFYDPLLAFLNFTKEVHEDTWVLYSNGTFKLCLCRCESEHSEMTFHRKRPGLNHLAFQVLEKEEVDRFHREFLNANGIPALYSSPGQFSDHEEYYAVFFEDPFRLKLEIVYAPKYLK